MKVESGLGGLGCFLIRSEIYHGLEQSAGVIFLLAQRLAFCGWQNNIKRANGHGHSVLIT